MNFWRWPSRPHATRYSPSQTLSSAPRHKFCFSSSYFFFLCSQNDFCLHQPPSHCLHDLTPPEVCGCRWNQSCGTSLTSAFSSWPLLPDVPTAGSFHHEGTEHTPASLSLGSLKRCSFLSQIVLAVAFFNTRVIACCVCCRIMVPVRVVCYCRQ